MAAPLAGSRIDHLNLSVPDLERSVAFYTPVLEVLGITTLLAVPADPEQDQLAMHGYGVGYKPFFWLVEKGRMGENVHLAFTADDRDTVHRFWDAALAAGAGPQLPPAVHEEYHPGYYGAFVLDPDGASLEAVCHEPA
jgi:catechol 2,3-dioxygenase-like lactoylglutathione lyase family enzyme